MCPEESWRCQYNSKNRRISKQTNVCSWRHYDIDKRWRQDRSWPLGVVSRRCSQGHGRRHLTPSRTPAPQPTTAASPRHGHRRQSLPRPLWLWQQSALPHLGLEREERITGGGGKWRTEECIEYRLITGVTQRTGVNVTDQKRPTKRLPLARPLF